MTPVLYHRGQNHKPQGNPLSFGDLRDTELGVDWLSVTFPMCRVEEVRVVLLDLSLGEAPKAGRGRQGWSSGEYYPNGPELHTGRPDDRAWLLLNGGACRSLGHVNLQRLASIAGIGGKCPRLDIRLDFFGSDLRLVPLVLEACQAGQLRHLRRFKPYPIISSDLEVLGEGVGLGSQPRYVRVYDKGLQTETLPRGQWVRFEAELKDFAAHEAFCSLFTAPSDAEFASRLLGRLLAVADFRVGPRDVESSRLPRPQWWSDLLASVELVRPAAPSEAPDLARWMEALTVQYGNLIREAARVAGIAPGAAFEALTHGFRVNRGTRDNPNLPLLIGFLSSSCPDVCEEV